MSKSVLWRTQFTPYDSRKYSLVCDDPSLAVQADKDLFNPNRVMKQYFRDGDISIFERRRGIYADISDLGSISSYSDVVKALEPVNNLFMTLPALEREEFMNDPIKFLDFAQNPDNKQWLIDRGFIKPTEVGDNESVVPPEQKADSVKAEPS
jgi:hypothetical protein